MFFLIKQFIITGGKWRLIVNPVYTVGMSLLKTPTSYWSNWQLLEDEGGRNVTLHPFVSENTLKFVWSRAFKGSNYYVFQEYVL